MAMTRPSRHPTPTTPMTDHSLLQESELVVVIFRTALIFLAVLIPFVGSMQPSRLPMQVSVVGASIYNLVIFILYWQRIRMRGQRYVMLLLDILLVTSWVYFTGNSRFGWVGSPLFPFYYVVIILGALWFGVRGTLLSALLISALYLGIVFIGSGTDFYPTALGTAVFHHLVYLFLVAIAIGYLVDTHKREREQLARSQAFLAQYQERFRAAQEVYEILVPDKPPRVAGLELASRWHPALKEGGGDFYDVITTGQGKTAIVIADVAGKSERGAIKVPLFKAAFLACAQVWEDPGDVLAQVNRIVFPQLQPDMFISACVVMIDRERHRLSFANAGQDPPIFVRGRSHEIIPLESGGLVLGVDDRATYPTEERVLEEGDTLCLYTDGITEARNPQGDEFGAQNLESRVLSGVGVNLSADEIAGNIYEAVQQFMHGEARHDDMTVVVMRYRPVKPEQPLV